MDNGKSVIAPGILVSTPDLRPSLLSILPGIERAGLLRRLVTTIGFRRDGPMHRMLAAMGPRAATLQGIVERRKLPEYADCEIRTIWGRELVRGVSSRVLPESITHRIWQWAEVGFDQQVAKRFAGHFECAYGMEHASLHTFAAQKAWGGCCVLRQVTAHARLVAEQLRSEANRFPDHVSPVQQLVLDEMDALVARKEAEYAAADLIVCNSHFVRDGFAQAGVPANKLVAAPTGCPPVSDRLARAGRGDGPLRFLYAGSVSLRKGFPHLLAAWRNLEANSMAELWIAGGGTINRDRLAAPGIRDLGLLGAESLARTLEAADVFVLPSVCEGRAHVVLEAMAAGLPVITTPESGCTDLLRNGVNGFEVPAGSSESLCEAMQWCLNHRSDVASMGANAAAAAGAKNRERANRNHVDAITSFLRARRGGANG